MCVVPHRSRIVNYNTKLTVFQSKLFSILLQLPNTKAQRLIDSNKIITKLCYTVKRICGL